MIGARSNDFHDRSHSTQSLLPAGARTLARLDTLPYPPGFSKPELDDESGRFGGRDHSGCIPVPSLTADSEVMHAHSRMHSCPRCTLLGCRDRSGREAGF